MHAVLMFMHILFMKEYEEVQGGSPGQTRAGQTAGVWAENSASSRADSLQQLCAVLGHSSWDVGHWQPGAQMPCCTS